MKTMIIALSGAALIVATPGVLARNVASKASDQQHHASKKHPRVVVGHAPWHATHAKGMQTDYPSAFGYAPSAPKDYTYENSTQAGGGGGSGM